jgi:hypothetical protein
MAYDARRGKVVIFGGAGTASLADTWEWDGATWTNTSPATGSPLARSRAAMAYDAAHGELMLFGGSAGVAYSDSWEWGGAAWGEATPAASPSSRFSHAMAYDSARGKVVLFGGSDTNGNVFADTWLYRYQNSTPTEACLYGLDGDGDRKIGCADPDCFGYCSPQCNPLIMTCDPAWSRCGDGTCQPVETRRSCPTDCGVPPPVCGDFLCEAPETMASCAGDCS